MDTNNVGLQLQIGGERALPKPSVSELFLRTQAATNRKAG
jgi:hypothetical protein